MWDPHTYLAFDDHRGRPFFDLLHRVTATDPREVVDLGCGPGNLTTTLGARWPSARVTGLDASAEMVAAARARGVAAEVGDVRDWRPGERTDVVVCNATLQWVPDHRDLMRRWMSALADGAWLAVQVPGNFGAPSHVLSRELAAEPYWRDALGGLVLRGRDAVAEPADYAASLAGPDRAVDVWETTYLQRLTGVDPVLAWITGTALRPVRAALSDELWERFLAELAPRLRAAYPPDGAGVTWFPFRRIFLVARRGPAPA